MSASRTARSLVATTMAAGAVVTALAMPAVAADRGHDRGHDRGSANSAIELGRIQYDSPGREDNSNRSRNAEWVDIKNTSRKPVKLNGWTLTDKAGHRYTFRHFTLAGRSTVRVHTGIGHDTRTDVFQDRRNYVWDNKDKAILKDRRGHVVDSKSWNRR